MIAPPTTATSFTRWFYSKQRACHVDALAILIHLPQVDGVFPRVEGIDQHGQRLFQRDDAPAGDQIGALLARLGGATIDFPALDGFHTHRMLPPRRRTRSGTFSADCSE